VTDQKLVTQVLYGDFFKVLEQRKKWSRIRIAFDKYEGWIDNKQYQEIEEDEYKEQNHSDLNLSNDLGAICIRLERQPLTPYRLGVI
jgi:hypothetical protein